MKALLIIIALLIVFLALAVEALDRMRYTKWFTRKASEIRTTCPDICGDRDTNTYLILHRNRILKEQKRIDERRAEATDILKSYPHGAHDICGEVSNSRLTIEEIETLFSKIDIIISEERKYESNQKELALLMPQYRKLISKYPLVERKIYTEKAEEMRKFLLIPEEELKQRQIREEDIIISDKREMSILTRRMIRSRLGKGIEETTTSFVGKYGERVAKEVELTIEKEERLATVSKFLESIIRKQRDFARESREILSKSLPTWEKDEYDFTLGHPNDVSMPVIQASASICCLDDTISYAYFPQLKDNRIQKVKLEAADTYDESTWSAVMSFISAIHHHYGDELYVILANTTGFTKETFKKHFNCLKHMLDHSRISYGDEAINIVSALISHSRDMTIIVVDMLTNNDDHIRYCEDIFRLRYNDDIDVTQGVTKIVFLSLLNCLNGAEVVAMNKKREEEQKREREEKERQKREEEQKQKDASDISKAREIAKMYRSGFMYFYPNVPLSSINAYLARDIIQKESTIMDHENIMTRIKSSVSGWDTVHGVPHYFFYYYYPVRFQNVSTDSEEARSLVYRFKDGVDHERVKDLVISKLRSTFSSSDLSQMTFVCIPASTAAVNRSRYEAFSREVCSALDMWNGFEHIAITREKTPSHLGGTDSAEYSFDAGFFKDRLVILFDDIVTRGGSVSSMKTNLESLGARVICAISIGRTFSDWNGQTPQPHPYTGRR